jgi:hypothetical protein
MAMSRAVVRSWVEGFEAAREIEQQARLAGGGHDAAATALELGDAALAARAPEMRARRDAEDARVRETWNRLKRRHAR